MWRVVKSKYLQLSSDFIEIFKSYYLQAFNYWRDSDQHQLCLMTTSLKFGIPLSKVFLDQKFYGDSKKLVRKKCKKCKLLKVSQQSFLSTIPDTFNQIFSSLPFNRSIRKSRQLLLRVCPILNLLARRLRPQLFFTPSSYYSGEIYWIYVTLSFKYFFVFIE